MSLLWYRCMYRIFVSAHMIINVCVCVPVCVYTHIHTYRHAWSCTSSRATCSFSGMDICIASPILLTWLYTCVCAGVCVCTYAHTYMHAPTHKHYEQTLVQRFQHHLHSISTFLFAITHFTNILAHLCAKWYVPISHGTHSKVQIYTTFSSAYKCRWGATSIHQPSCTYYHFFVSIFLSVHPSVCLFVCLSVW